MTPSLGFATDVALRTLEGSRVERLPGRTVVRTPENPGFRWGNFILVTEPGVPVRRMAEHRAAFPDAAFVTVGIDDARPGLDDDRWRSAGFEVERLTVLEAAIGSTDHEPGARPLTSEEDWAAETAISLELEPDADAAHLEFTRRATAVKRAATERGGMVWLGVERDGGIVATAGIGDAGGGVARFQDVQTRTAHRRRGHATTLVTAGMSVAARTFVSARCVLVAEPDGPAIGLYRRLGFREVETQVQLTRVDRVGGAA